jgi:hypothetical protein
LTTGFADPEEMKPQIPLRIGRDDNGEGGASISISCRWSEPQIPPLRFDGMTKERAPGPVIRWWKACEKAATQLKGGSLSLAHTSFGRQGLPMERWHGGNA